MRVLLIRHGRSAYVHPGGLLDREGFQHWRTEYDAAGIARDDRPPENLVTEVALAAAVAASDLLRARASAALLAPRRAVIVSSLFREIPLPIPFWTAFRAPRAVWDTVSHVRWFLDIARGSEAPSGALEQARRASEWCRATCRREQANGGSLAVVTHGSFRRLLAARLVADGWHREAGRRRYVHWSAWRFSLES